MTSLPFSTTKQVIPTSRESVATAASKLGMITFASFWLTTTAGPSVLAHSKFVDTSKKIEFPKSSETSVVHDAVVELSPVGADFAKIFAEATAGVPDEEWNNLPSDFSANLRKYMYGDRT